MRAFGQRRMFSWLVGAGLLYYITVPSQLLADDKDGKSAPAAPASAKAAKVDAPTPLTERERMLLDRVELLEKRVAELEAGKGRSERASAAEVAGSAPSASGGSGGGANGVGMAGASSELTAASGNVTNVIPAEKAMASASAQASEKGKSGASKAPKSEPFAFADFTWLNGNARTKESPMDTKFFPLLRRMV